MLLGIDVGTTGVRAAVLDARGRVAGEASEPCPHAAPAPGRAEADAERWWQAAGTACRALSARGLLEGVEAVGVTGQAPTTVLVDAGGAPIGPALLWLDVRAAAQARALDQALGPGRAEAIGGNRLHPYFLGPKLAWLRAVEPWRLDRAALVLQSHAFLVQRLTGEAACDRSTAMLCTPLFDARRGQWSEEGARAVGISVGQLPGIAQAHDVVGRVTRAAATATGLLEGTPVVAGGGDFAASALGAGVVDEGQGCLMLGTAGNLLLPAREPRFDTRLIQSHHVGADRWLALGGTLCGAALEWSRAACARGAAWEELEAEGDAAGAGAGGVVMLPYLQGERTPVWDERARGAFSGLSLAHGRGHLYRALVEGIALGFRHSLDVARSGGTVLTEVIAANGAGRSRLLRQTLADALGVPVTWSSDGMATVTGAAMLAGLGIGAIPGAAACRGWRAAGPVERHVPDPVAAARLEVVFARRLALAEAEIAAREP